MNIEAHRFTKYWIDFVEDRNGGEADHLAYSPFSHLHSYRKLMNVVPFFVIDSSGDIVYTNKQIRNLVGDRGEQMDGHSLKSFILPTDHPINDQKESQEYELCFPSNEEEEEFNWLKGYFIPTQGIGESFRMFFGLNHTSDKKKQEERAVKIQENFSQTMNALINLVFKVVKAEDGSFRYSMFEGKLAQDIGLTTEKVNGRTLEEIFGNHSSLFYKEKYSLGFSGEVVSYKHHYQGRTFYTTLSPVGVKGGVQEVIGSSLEITSYEEAESKIKHMASHDPLTDLPNRIKLLSDLSIKIEECSSFTVIFCNLDRFKYVNDAFGHFAGDQVIQMMAERLSSLTAESGRLYRVGGDEFIITLCGEHSQKEVRTLGDRIIQNLSLPIRSFGKQFFITASIGVAQYPLDASKSTDLIMCADVALQYSKMNGRQLLSFYKPEMNRDYNQLLSLEGDLREAISKNQLSLYYQPKVDVQTGYVSGMEALVRWHHPEKGMISPGQFIPIAEETGIITQLDDWVLREACKQSQNWIDRGYAPERIAVNVSANEIQRRDFAGKVYTILNETGLEARYLEIEVTEDSVMQNTEQCIRTMQDLKAMGISLSIDDFGTGYSSLSYLRKFPIHYLKIDQAFIKGVLTDPSDAEIVKAMIHLADAFKLEVVAEGVEHEEVLVFLRENNCAYYQGYYFSEPVSATEIERYLSKKQEYQ